MTEKIIFLHGFGGSKIYCRCNRLKSIKMYPKLFIPSHFYKCKNKHTEIIRRVFFISVYGNFLATYPNIEPFSYDWTQTPLHNAKILQKFLDDNVVRNQSIILIGHSLGGLIIRIMIEHLHYFKNISRVFLFGTPLWGSNSFKDYNMEYELYLAIITRQFQNLKTPMQFTTRDKFKFMKHFPETLKYLMPTYTIMGNCSTVQFSREIKSVHESLSKFNFPMEYTIYFNCGRLSRRRIVNKCNFLKNEMDAKIVHYIKQVNDDNTILLSNVYIKTDGLIVAYSSSNNLLNSKCKIVLSKNFTLHSLMMNQIELEKL